MSDHSVTLIVALATVAVFGASGASGASEASGAGTAPAAPAPISYQLDYQLATADRVEIRLALPALTVPQTLVIPRAVPMGYGEQRYDRFVSGVRGFSQDGRPLAVTREEGPRWRFDSLDGAAELTSILYRVDVAEMERRVLSAADASKARPGYLGLLGYSVFGYLEGSEGRPVELEVRAPVGWPAFTTLAPTLEGASITRGTAADFYALADSQVLMGPDLRRVRVAEEPDLFVAAYAEAALDLEVVAELGRQALGALVEYFGSAPFPQYSLVIEVLEPVSPEHEYGFSMEHMDSATFFLGVERTIDGETSQRELDRHLYNYAHHIAHSWIPKRCHGEGYFPFSWELAPVLDTIWFSEGFGQYAAAAALAAQMPERPDYLERLVASRFQRSLDSAPTSIRRLSTVELSRVASTRYGQDFRTGKSSFSRGGLMAAEMDARIRERSEGTRSLRDSLRYLVEWSRREGRPFTLEELPELLERGARVDLRDIFERWMSPRAPSG